MSTRSLLLAIALLCALGPLPVQAQTPNPSSGQVNQPPPEEQGEHLFREDNAKQRLLLLGGFAVVVLIGGAVLYRWLTSESGDE